MEATKKYLISGDVVVVALHPVAGSLYWRFIDESDCNYPDYFGITADINAATVFKSGLSYGRRSFESFRSNCLTALSEVKEIWNEERGKVDFVCVYSTEVIDLACNAGCEPKELAAWLHKANWVEQPPPSQENLNTIEQNK